MMLCSQALAQALPLTYESHRTAESVAGGQIAITVPDDVEVGDFLVAQISFGGGTSTEFVSVPDGWGMLAREDQLVDLGHAVFFKVVGSDGAIPAPGTAFQWVFNQPTNAIGGMTRYSGVDFVNPLQGVDSRSGNSAALLAPAVALQEPGAVLGLFSIAADTSVNPPSKLTKRYELNSELSGTAALADVTLQEAGGTGNWNVISDQVAAWTAHSLALRSRLDSSVSPALSTITADPDELPADGESTALIFVVLVDYNGDAIDETGLAVELASDAGTLIGTVNDHGEGVYSQLLQSSEQIETATVTGTVNGFAIGNSANVAFVAGEADPLHSTIAADASQLPADPAASTPVTVQVRDAFGNPVATAGLNVTLSTTLGTLDETAGTTGTEGRFTTNLNAAASPGTAVISGTLDGETIDDTAEVQFVVSDADATQSTISVADNELVADGTSSTTVTVQARDAAGDPLAQAGLAVTVSADLGTLTDTSGLTDAGGQFSTTLTAPTTVGQDLVTGTLLGANIGDTATVDYVAGQAAQLAFGVQPQDSPAGETFSTQVRVEDANGNLIEGAGNSVSLALTDAAGATLSGTTTTSAVNGLAGFSGLSIDRAGFYTLTASADGLTAAISMPFEIVAGAPTALKFYGQPATSARGRSIRGPVEVHLSDSFGNSVSNANATISVSIESGPAGASLSGSTEMATTDGAAVFADVVVDMVGSYRLRAAADGLSHDVSDEFLVREDSVFSDRFQGD